MTTETIHLNDSLNHYLEQYSVKENPVQKALREATSKLPLANMQIAPEQGQFLQMLIKLSNAKRCIEVGTFTGYSALTMALALPDDGELICCELNPNWSEYSLPHWKKANIDHKVTLNIAPAIDTLNHLIENNEEGQFDLIFIDADKTNYINYYEASLKLVKHGGIIVIDNIFWNGAVIDNSIQDRQTIAIRELTKHISQDERVFSCIVPIADGVYLVHKK